MAEEQLKRAGEVCRLAERLDDREKLGSGAYFRAVAGYVLGRPDVVDEAVADSQRAEASSQRLWTYATGSLLQGRAFLRGDVESAERRAERLLSLGDCFGTDQTEGPYGVQMFMIRRETGALDALRAHVSGPETFDGRWVPGLLALYTELGVADGVDRALRHLLNRDLAAQVHGAQCHRRRDGRADGCHGAPVRDPRAPRGVRRQPRRRVRASSLAQSARDLAAPIGQQRVLTLLDSRELSASDSANADDLSEREVAVLRLLAEGLSNREIGHHRNLDGNPARPLPATSPKTSAASGDHGSLARTERGSRRSTSRHRDASGGRSG